MQLEVLCAQGPTKKRSAKKAAQKPAKKKKPAKKRSTKKPAKKRSTKKAAKKRSTKKATKKAAKKPAKKRSAKKAKKKPTKKLLHKKEELFKVIRSGGPYNQLQVRLFLMAPMHDDVELVSTDPVFVVRLLKDGARKNSVLAKTIGSKVPTPARARKLAKTLIDDTKLKVLTRGNAQLEIVFKGDEKLVTSLKPKWKSNATS